MRTIVFVFAGRRPNMELQLPFIRRILEEHPQVEYHVWNLTRNKEDDAYVRGISGERIIVHNDFGPSNQRSFSGIYRHYGGQEYQGCSFVKLDDDIVFIHTARFGAFLAAITTYPGQIITAQVVNNGACTPVEPGLWKAYEQLEIPLLDVHKSNEYGAMAHQYFFDHYGLMLTRPVALIPTEDWLSINLIGYDSLAAREIADRIGEVPHPSHIAGRYFPAPWGVADEGMMNMFPRIIMRGFVAGHLTFGPQHCPEGQQAQWRKGYGPISRRYLDAAVPEEVVLPELSPVSCAYRPPERDGNILPGQNNPCVGRYVP